MDEYSIGHFLSKLRKEKGLKQKEVAEAIQVSDKAVSRWETGKGIPDVDSLQGLSDFYEVSINEILAGRYLREDEIKEISDCNLTQMGKKASRLKKSLLLAVAAIMGLFILLVGFFVYRHTVRETDDGSPEVETEEKFIYLTSNVLTDEYVTSYPSTEEMGIIGVSTSSFEYSGNLDDFELKPEDMKKLP